MKPKYTVFSSKNTLNIKGNIVDLSTPVVMGILNVTPDSFYDGGRFVKEKEILLRVEKMLTEGAAIIDVGGYSSRPGADEISEEEEEARVINAVKLILKEFPQAHISIDTFRASVAKISVNEGASLINDISGGTLDPLMFETVARLNVPYILMHMKGNPQTMRNEVKYENLLLEITDFLQERINLLRSLGVKDIIIDPGIGFAKTITQNFEILKNLKIFNILGSPLLLGVSRKSLIYKTLKLNVEEALNGTTILNTIGLVNGASILRVHDVKQAVEAIKLYKLVYS